MPNNAKSHKVLSQGVWQKMKRRALFLDRDGTLVHAVHYPSRAKQPRLYASIGPALRELQQKGFFLFVSSKQSGIAHGYFSEADMQTMHAGLAQQLQAFGVHLDPVRYCPHHSQRSVPQFTQMCACRNQQPGMLLQVAAECAIDLGGSGFIGDTLGDSEAGNRAGCHPIVVDLATEAWPANSLRWPAFVALDTVHALEMVGVVTALEPTLDLVYRSQTWKSGTEQSAKEQTLKAAAAH
jgi:D-glycero-D-manno-heptose 1,7-bisphosphate phosphatase